MITKIKLFEKFDSSSNTQIGCLMIYFDVKKWNKFVKENVEEKDLYKPDDEDYGYNKYAHSTLLFGLHDYIGIQKDLDNFLPKLETIDDIEISDKMSIFKNDDFDVVKIEVKSKKMKKLNKKLRKNFDYTNDHHEYSPHITIAYVKKGLGEKYDKEEISGEISDNMLDELVVSDYVYSDPKYKKTKIKPQ